VSDQRKAPIVRFSTGIGELREAPAADWPTALRTMGAVMRKMLPEAVVAREPYTQALIASYERADVTAHPPPWSVFACGAFAVQAYDAQAAEAKGWNR
jgi:hypothetical protein